MSNIPINTWLQLKAPKCPAWHFSQCLPCHWGHQPPGRAAPLCPILSHRQLHAGSTRAVRRHRAFPLPHSLWALPAQTVLLWGPGTRKHNSSRTQGKAVGFFPACSIFIMPDNHFWNCLWPVLTTKGNLRWHCGNTAALWCRK